MECVVCVFINQNQPKKRPGAQQTKTPLADFHCSPRGLFCSITVGAWWPRGRLRLTYMQLQVIYIAIDIHKHHMYAHIHKKTLYMHIYRAVQPTRDSANPTNKPEILHNLPANMPKIDFWRDSLKCVVFCGDEYSFVTETTFKMLKTKKKQFF